MTFAPIVPRIGKATLEEASLCFTGVTPRHPGMGYFGESNG